MGHRPKWGTCAFPFCQVLDKLLLYLRIVHSLDYYNTCEYPNEDEMPNRCGIIHVRGPMPPNRISHGEGEPQLAAPFPSLSLCPVLPSPPCSIPQPVPLSCPSA